ncbi:helix-turn-helix domain-containing protein [Bacillus sp. V3]|nr:helix-turn-helix domain-containing protein [Bacillus sp. V3]
MDEFRMSLGEKIQLLRKKSFLSQKDLGEGICSQAFISQIEQGKIAVSAEVLYQLSVKLGVDTNYFFEQSDSERKDYIEDVIMLARGYIHNRDYDTLAGLIKSEENSPLLKQKRYRQFIIWNKSIIALHVEKNPQMALRLAEEALNMKETSSNTYSLREIEILITKGNILIELKRIKHAITTFETAKMHIHSTIHTYSHNIYIRLFFNLARAYYSNEQYEDSLSTTVQGISYCKQQKSTYGLGELYYQKAMCMEKHGKYQLAAENYLISKFIFKLNKDDHLSAKADSSFEDLLQEHEGLNKEHDIFSLL